MRHRVSLDFIGTGNAAEAYGGKLEAWSFIDIEPDRWFEQFRSKIAANLGKSYLPVYRMADGEYRFLMGRKINRYRRPLIKELLGYLVEKTGLHGWATSWGESYDLDDFKKIKLEYISALQKIASSGFLGLYINDNGLNAFIEYNQSIETFFKKNNIELDKNNYIPFHFVCHLLSGSGCDFFYRNRKILIVTSFNSQKRQQIEHNLLELGAKTVQFLKISATKSMQDKIDCSRVERPIDLCLVAAGIGAANILNQLKPLQTVALDIGGFMNCLQNPSLAIHGGVFTFPKVHSNPI